MRAVSYELTKKAGKHRSHCCCGDASLGRRNARAVRTTAGPPRRPISCGSAAARSHAAIRLAPTAHRKHRPGICAALPRMPETRAWPRHPRSMWRSAAQSATRHCAAQHHTAQRSTASHNNDAAHRRTMPPSAAHRTVQRAGRASAARGQTRPARPRTPFCARRATRVHSCTHVRVFQVDRWPSVHELMEHYMSSPLRDDVRPTLKRTRPNFAPRGASVLVLVPDAHVCAWLCPVC